MALCPLLSAWGAQQAFITLQHSGWGQAHLAQIPPAGSATLVNMYFGVVASYVFEYLHDRWAHRDARERMAHRLTTDAQLQLLRAQLDPHMLFNTLSNLYELIDESPQQARTMLLHLIAFLRSTLDGSRSSHHALADEFKLASDYLALMQIRMGERLRATLSLPDALRAISVPAMLLQPVIENAIRHGLEHRRHGGELTVAAAQEAGQLVLRVRNSGSQDTAHPASTKPGGFGLHSVRERMVMLFGPGDHVALRHLHELDATEVTLRLPLQNQKGAA
jgi:LytS/YehU family sensor histidine kinase